MAQCSWSSGAWRDPFLSGVPQKASWVSVPRRHRAQLHHAARSGSSSCGWLLTAPAAAPGRLAADLCALAAAPTAAAATHPPAASRGCPARAAEARRPSRAAATAGSPPACRCPRSRCPPAVRGCVAHPPWFPGTRARECGRVAAAPAEGAPAEGVPRAVARGGSCCPGALPRRGQCWRARTWSVAQSGERWAGAGPAP